MIFTRFFQAVVPSFALVVILLCITGRAEGAASPTSDLEAKLTARLKKEIDKSGFKAGDLGIWVGARTDKMGEVDTYFSQNSDKLFIPASTSKLVTLGAVLHELKPSYKFKTNLVSSAKIAQGALQGDLYLKGAGDPAFVSENMWFIVNELTRAGVSSVEGDVVVDDLLYDHVRWGDDRQEERVDRAYDAPLGAMSMNWNSVSVYVRPGDKVGDKLKVFADVASPYIKVKNETKTVAAGKGKTVTIERTSEEGFNGDVVVVSGAMALGLPELTVYKNITQPDVWSGYNLVEFLRQRGVAVKGKVRTGAAPKDAAVLATSESKALSFIVADMAKWSNNYVADMLVKAVSAEAGEAPATFNGGLEHVLKYLDGTGLKRADYSFVNAAGFTRKNKLTPKQLGRVLERVRADFVIFPEYLQALPIAGVDGTLRNRMKGTAAEHWVRAKTGLLNGVAALAGYAGRENGQIVAFAFFYNGGGALDKARGLFDQMAASLVEE
jgi:D-alanyl-D-alanine carboxypeptidase/D-alanyl-D-alanine-endopeptidase (penicillin-binding protein 4)